MLQKIAIFALFYLSYCLARICDDTLKGICETDDAFSAWCTYDKKTKEASCDHQQFCANHTRLQGKVDTAGCIGHKCCCNQKQLCNQQFLEVPTQKCQFKTQVPNEHTLIYNDCEGPWCFAMITSTLVGGETTTLQGCESRSMLKHLENRVEVKENETAWQLSDPFFKQIRCAQIVTNETQPDMNDTRRECVDFEYIDAYRVQRSAKLCCCSGSDYCNQQIEWTDQARFLESELLIDQDDNGEFGEMSSASTVTLALTNLCSLFLVVHSCFAPFQ